jgi:hypothetical protein
VAVLHTPFVRQQITAGEVQLLEYEAEVQVTDVLRSVPERDEQSSVARTMKH